jgi:hypothetical protein
VNFKVALVFSLATNISHASQAGLRQFYGRFTPTKECSTYPAETKLYVGKGDDAAKDIKFTYYMGDDGREDIYSLGRRRNQSGPDSGVTHYKNVVNTKVEGRVLTSRIEMQTRKRGEWVLTSIATDTAEISEDRRYITVRESSYNPQKESGPGEGQFCKFERE